MKTMVHLFGIIDTLEPIKFFNSDEILNNLVIITDNASLVLEPKGKVDNLEKWCTKTVALTDWIDSVQIVYSDKELRLSFG